MSSTFSEEQDQLRDLVRSFLEQKSPSSEVRRLMDSNECGDKAVWRQMADQLGLQGVSIEEQYGGSGCGVTELGIVAEEMGRALFVSPYFSTVVMAGQTLSSCEDTNARARWLPGIADGSLTATLAVTESSGRWDLSEVATYAKHEQGEWLLTGTKMFVIDGHTADLILVAARTDSGLAVFGVDGGSVGLTRSKLDAIDQTRALSVVEFSRTPGILLAGDGADLLDRAADLIVSVLANEQIGGAAMCLEMAVDYAKVREQFGRPIGSFQAIKHKCADMLLEVESGRSAAYHAAAVAADGSVESSIGASLAKAYCSDAYTHSAKENIQIHGGIGFTWEHDAHLHLKRAKSSEILFGNPSEHRTRLADLVGI
ncbi:MAG: acyl-CoA dehydrogenase [Gordonia sp.]|nr:acyl-CoA dehydrogenase [Gordonia sp. (in: high G+C Gram-positive bacteria)]